MNKNLISSITLLLIIFALTIKSPGETKIETQSYTLDQLIQKAYENYPLLTAADLKVEEYLYKSRQEGKWQNPRIEASGGARLSDNDTGYEYNLALSQGFYLSGKQQLKKDIMLLRKQYASLSAQDMKNFVRHQVTMLTYLYAVALIKRDHIRERHNRFKLIQAYMKGRVAASPKQRVDKSIIEARTLLLSKYTAMIKEEVYILFNRLNLYTGLTLNDLPRIEVNWYKEPPHLDCNDPESCISDKNIAILKRISSVKQAEKELALARRLWAPDLDLSVYYNEESLDNNTDRAVGAAVSMPLPIIDQNRDAVKAGEKKLEFEKIQLENTRRLAITEMSSLLVQYASAMQMVLTFTIARLEEIEKTMAYADSEFIKGRIDLPTYLEIDSESHEIIETVYSSQLDLIRLYSKYKYIRGE